MAQITQNKKHGFHYIIPPPLYVGTNFLSLNPYAFVA